MFNFRNDTSNQCVIIKSERLFSKSMFLTIKITILDTRWSESKSKNKTFCKKLLKPKCDAYFQSHEYDPVL